MVNVDNIPAELKDAALWCAWKYETRGGSKKPTKIPYNPKTGKRAKSNDPCTFVSFQEAHEKFIWGQYEGLGVGVFGTLCAVDIDHCISADGAYSDMAQDIITAMDSYTEVSPSGTGVRILFYAAGLEYDKARYYINNQKAGLEVYVAGITQKYVTVTGNINTPGKAVEERAEQLQIILDKYMQRNHHSERHRWLHYHL